MPPVRKSKAIENSILNEMLAVRLQQLEVENGGMEAFLPRTGLARGTYYQVLRGIGNPTLKTLDRIATSLDMSVLELLGFEIDDARRALQKSGVDYDALATALGTRNEASKRVADARARRPAENVPIKPVAEPIDEKARPQRKGRRSGPKSREETPKEGR